MQIYYDDIIESEHRIAFLEFVIKSRQFVHNNMLCTKQHFIVLTSDDIRRSRNGERVRFTILV